MKERLTILCGDALEQLRALPDCSVQCCVTSPPYWGLRDYGVSGQIGLERSVEDWVAKLVDVFREVRRVLRNDGTLWLNLGDCYGSGTAKGRKPTATGKHGYWENPAICLRNGAAAKQLLGLPWRIAFALQEDGWWLRQENIWAKTNPMPESVTDRTTRAHETVFHLSKSARYYYDAEAIKEPVTGNAHGRGNGVNPKAKTPGVNSRQDRDPNHHSTARKPRQNESFSAAVNGLVNERNKRSVWTIALSPYREAHFATFPPALVKPCILAGCPANGVVLDPFAGSGTTGQVALELGRRAVLIELNPNYVKLIERRCAVTPGLALA